MKRSTVKYRVCQKQDIPQVEALLRSSGLPTEDVTLHKIDFLLAVGNKEIIGCIGLEKYRDHGLLRSLAVKDLFRNQGVGSALYENFVIYCRQQGVWNLHLFTIDAHEFFQARGFTITNRSSAPESIQQTTEFTQLCPASSSVYMTLEIDN
jgi:amino-acid N-acetyltransferase